MVRAQRGSQHIVKLIRGDGVEVTGQADIMELLQGYYERLYSSRSGGGEEDLAHYLTQIPLPTLSSESRQLLEQPITIEEL